MSNRRNKTPVPPNVRMTRETPETLERELIFGMAKFYKFYQAMREVVCPYDSVTKSYRQDFTVSRYNVLYGQLDEFYRRFDNKTETRKDMGMQTPQLAAYISNRIRNGKIPKDIGARLVEEINDETEYSAALDLYSLQALAGSAPFADWLKTRATKHTMITIDEKRKLGLLTMEGLADAVERLRLAITPTNTDDMVNGAVFIHGSRKIMPSVALDSFPLLCKAIGGGFYWGDSTMIAGTNGGGKTILIMQLADAFATAGLRTVVFTTERRPDELFMRCVSNRLEVDLRRLNDTSKSAPNVEGEMPYIPDWLRQDQLYKGELERMEAAYGTNLLCVDWSNGEGQNIPTHFDPAMEKIERTGWIPQVVLFDWIGGGLGVIKENDYLRLYYQAAADHLINHAKRTKRIMIISAQLDKSVVLPKKTYVDMSMLSECKTMTNNLTNFIGITSLRDNKAHDDEGAYSVTHRRQNLCIAKATRGVSGSVIPVNADFQYQRFEEISS